MPSPVQDIEEEAIQDGPLTASAMDHHDSPRTPRPGSLQINPHTPDSSAPPCTLSPTSVPASDRWQTLQINLPGIQELPLCPPH